MALVHVSLDERQFWSEFIKLYSNFPILWFKTRDSKAKHSKHLRDRAFNILLRKYRELQPAATVGMLKQVLRTLHSSYREELRMVIEQEQASENELPVNGSLSWCFEELNFLRSQEEERCKIDLIRDEAKSCLSFNSTHVPDGGSLENSTDQEDDIDIYCRSLAATMRELSEDQLNHAKHNIDIIMNRGSVGALAPGCMHIETTHESTSASKIKHSKPPFKETNSQTDDMDIEEVKFEDVPSDDESHAMNQQQVQEVDVSLENIEITVIDVQDVPADTEEQTFETASCETNENNFVAVRLPSGPTLRRQCTKHFSKYVDNVVLNYNDEEFLRQFRMGRNIVKMLCQQFEATYAYTKLTGHGGYEAISAQTHLLAFLWFLGHEKTSYRDVADRFELSVSCLHDVIWRVCDSILSMEADVIKWPDEEKKSTYASYFSDFCTLPSVIGCIDGTQIKIDKPFENSERYLLRKGYHSIQLQAIIDEELRFVDIFVEYPGEPEILAGVKHICGDRYCLLGGNGYPCLPQVLVPYSTAGKPLSKAQKSFNEQMHKAHAMYGKVFHHLKQRFRQLYHLKGRQLSRIVKLIKVCCILHNLAPLDEMILLENDPNDRREESCVSVPVFTYTSENQSKLEVALGQQQRDAICANF